MTHEDAIKWHQLAIDGVPLEVNYGINGWSLLSPYSLAWAIFNNHEIRVKPDEPRVRWIPVFPDGGESHPRTTRKEAEWVISRNGNEGGEVYRVVEQPET